MSATLTSRPLPNLETRRPTGKPSWPTVLLAGVEGSGKTWKAVSLSTWDVIDRTLFIEVGEDAADEYGALPGADYEIVPHDGSYLGILDAIRWAVAQPAADGKRNAIILDSGSILWDLLVDEQQVIANRRAVAKAKRFSKPVPREDQDMTITTDQWNTAKDRWLTVTNLLRRHAGPAVVCCRLQENTVMVNGEPTKDKEWKPGCHKSFPFDATVYVQMRSPFATGQGHGQLIKARSATADLNNVDMGEDWTLTGLFKVMGLDKTVATGSTYVEPNAGAYEAEYDAETATNEAAAAQGEQTRRAADAGEVPNAEQILAWIKEALTLDPAEGRRKLLMVKSNLGASNLEKITGIPTKNGPVNAAVAIDMAIEVTKAAAAGGSEQQPTAPAQPTTTPGDSGDTGGAPAVPAQPDPTPAPPAAEPTPEPVAETPAAPAEAPAEPTPAPAEAEVKPKRQSPNERLVAIGLEEVQWQAEVLGTSPRAHLGDLLADDKADPRTVKPAKLRAFVVSARASVCAQLAAQGRATECDAYARIGDAFPVRMADVFERTDG